MEERKKDHIDLAFKSQIPKDELDRRFYYEPALSAHPAGIPGEFKLAGKKQRVPMWVSSMTGGTKMAGTINRNLATACREFGMGMGLGSCRIILDDKKHFEDFNVRHVIGNDMPFFANLGIAQVEELVRKNEIGKIDDLIGNLHADGLIIHINPLQELFQPEGDRLEKPPLETIIRVLGKLNCPLIVKEVGQGMGYHSLKALLELPLEAVEFAAFGGTNFARLELMRSKDSKAELFEPLARVGHDANDMTNMVNQITTTACVKCKSLIISGGIKSYLDGYYLINKSILPAVYGQASGFLKYARESYEELRDYVQMQVRGLEMAYTYLEVRDKDAAAYPEKT